MKYAIQRKRRIHTVKWDSCVRKVKRKGTAVNPFAVCTSQLGKSSFTKKIK